ncbi:MAG TPA: bifunctional 3,4-dihydroxy-2-butanone-4-phosphate synthase/GTP cyclohydrolase II [Candidatus Dormibacteraeota bacterium]|jgi:3,4-dihydroxy 2-butanone 4-phosphate synthase/GTP cyclohydrolase II|nr:bifunctional 3,4-dihydroxy-2-butanone-4-phosphate synthase/GTP cyclohydrolase II [Candidatus Dormibacteraeota bacterium]
MPVVNIEQAIDDVKQGKFLIVVDDEDRENEGDLFIAADFVSADAINFMATHGRGLICTPLEGSRLDDLGIEPMVGRNTAPLGTAFTVSVEARHKVSTGISAEDRASTVKALIDPTSKPTDFSKPGHTFPLRAREGGVLVRAGQTEAAVDLARMAGLYPAGVICEIMKEDGTMARMPDLEKFSKKHGIGIVTIKDLITYRRRWERLVELKATAQLPTEYGIFEIRAYEDTISGETHVALVMGDVNPDEPVLLRAHSECLTGDAFHSLRCDCEQQLHRSMEMIAEEGAGVVLYLRQEGRGIGLLAKLMAYELQDQGMDTVEANEALGLPVDKRDYGIGSQILADLGVRKIRLISNSPRKYYGIESFGLEIVERIPLVVEPNEHNVRYLRTKSTKLGHIMHD